MVMAMEELHTLQPKIFRDVSPSMMKELSLEKRIAYFRTALESCRDSWIEKENLSKSKKEERERLENVSLDHQLVHVVALTLDCVIKAVIELFDPTGEAEKTSSLDQKNNNGDPIAKENKTINDSNNRLVENTKEDVKQNARDEGMKSTPQPSKAPMQNTKMPSKPPPTPPPSMTRSGGPPPPPPGKGGGAMAPPPPPPGAGKLSQKKVNKLRRSTMMSSLFQNAQKKMEGTLTGGKSANAVKKQLGGSAGGDRGLDAALAEMAKRYGLAHSS